MSPTNAHEQELREIAIAATSGEVTDEQFARLDELVRSDPRLANYTARIFDQQASLIWQGAARGLATTHADNLATPASLSTATIERSAHTSVTSTKRTLSWQTIAVGIAFLLGMAALPLARRALLPDGAMPLNAIALQPTYQAQLIDSTACLWDGNSTGSREIGSSLGSGESLHLLEGLAEYKLSWAGSGNAKLSLEGPAAMMLTSEGMPTLRFGRLTASINTSYRPFVLDTPVGRLTMADYGSVGVSAFGNEGEIHVFDGTAMLEPAWLSPDQLDMPIRITAGEAIHVQADKNGEPTIRRHSADPAYFAAQVSMSSDGLVVPRSYVDAVKQSAPLAYWRFERDTWPRVPNIMGDRLACQVNGSLGTAIYLGNESVEFGVTNQGGEILSSEPIDGSIKDSYSIEMWVKPSHYHLGAVVSLVGDTPNAEGVIPHGMLLELGGSGKIPNAVHHPGCIRFLHRSPAGNEPEIGTSCYSKDAYTLRKWQHVVATKDGDKMRLYVNCIMVAEGKDSSELPPGLRLLVGKLYPSRGGRPFIGQLDELALYNRALTPDEIVKHYRLVRPATADDNSI